MQILQVLRGDSTAHSGDKNSLLITWVVFVKYIRLINIVKIQKKVLASAFSKFPSE